MNGEAQEWPHDGEVLEYDPPRHLDFTWLSPSTNGVISTVMIKFTKISGEETELELVHEDLGDNFSSFDQGWSELFDQLVSVFLNWEHFAMQQNAMKIH